MSRRLPPKKYDPDAPVKPLPKTNFSKRYDNMKASIDTGMTVPKLIEALKNRMPTGEIFRRIRPAKLKELLALHFEELEAKERLAQVEPEAEHEDGPVPAYHHMHSSIVFDDKEQPKPQPKAYEVVDCPFILLDVRDEDEFEQCHIHLAKCYPKARLSRATGQFTPEILTYRDRPDGMVVVYCDYGQTSGEAAQMFAERGFSNVFLLHGGLADFAEEYPTLVGPGEPPKPQKPQKKTTQSSAASMAGGPRPAQKKPTRAALAVAAKPGDKKVWK